MPDLSSDDYFAALKDAAQRQHGPELSENLRNAINAIVDLPDDNYAEKTAKILEVVKDAASPTGSGFLAVWLGAGVEQGKDPELTLQPILDTFLKWGETIATAPEESEEDDPEPDEETIFGMQLLGQALVAHLSRAPNQRKLISETEQIFNELERIEHLSVGAGWILQLLRQCSDELVILNVEKKKGVLVRYENISNCFHLFTLLQGTLADVMPEANNVSDDLTAIARGEQEGDVHDVALWHYGQGNVPEPAIAASVWGEMSPKEILRVDGSQVLLLWPPILESRSWNSGFFVPFLAASPPNVELTNILSAAEIEQWWSRLDLPDPKP